MVLALAPEVGEFWLFLRKRAFSALPSHQTERTYSLALLFVQKLPTPQDIVGSSGDHSAATLSRAHGFGFVLPRNRGLSSREAGYRHAIGRAGDVVHACPIAELDGRRVAAVL